MPPIATGQRPTYDVTISDGTTTLGLMTLDHKAEHIRRLPRGVGVERKKLRNNDWSGGRGQEFLKDPSRWMDGLGLWTMVAGQLTGGPCPVPTFAPFQRGYGAWVRDRDSAGNQPANYAALGITPVAGAAQSFVAATATTLGASRVRFAVRRIGTPTGPLRIALHSDSGSTTPGTIQREYNLAAADAEEYIWAIRELDFISTYNMTNGLRYWISWMQPTGAYSDTNYWEIVAVSTVAGGDQAYYHDGSSWGTSGWSARVVWQVCQDINKNDFGTPIFFEYKRQLYFINGDVALTGINMNGDRGVATGAGQTTSTLQDTTKAWTSNQWKGCTLYFSGGPLKGESRLVSSNTSDTLTLTEALRTAPTTGAAGDEYAILGSDTWQHLAAGVALGTPSDVCVVNDIVYFGFERTTAMVRMRSYNNAGAWTVEWATDGTNDANLLTVVFEGSKTYVYRARNSTVAVSRAEKQNWGTNLTFETDIPIGTTEYQITGMVWHDDKLYVAKEDDLFAVRSGVPAQIANPFHQGRDLTNGRNLGPQNTNLYIPFLDGLVRFYGSVGDDIGPNRDAGLPADRRGVIADWAPVFGYGFAAVDGGSTRKSSIQATLYPGGGWHELFRGSENGRRIRALFYQSVPLGLNRLWFASGLDTYYMTMPRSASNPLNDSGMVYGWGGYVTTSWIDGEAVDLDKLFNELSVYSRNLGGGYNGLLYVHFQLESESGAWTLVTPVFDTSPSQTYQIATGTSRGRRIRFRYTLMPSKVQATPVINSIDLGYNQMAEIKYDYVINVYSSANLQLLHGDLDTTSSILALLDAWQENATRLTLNTRHPLIQSVYGHIDPVAIVLKSFEPNAQAWEGSITFKQA